MGSGEFKVYILLGAPGAGKGTQSALMVSHLSLFHFSLGDEFRAIQADKSSPFYENVSSKMSSGELVGEDIVFEVFNSKFREIVSEGVYRGIIVDGFPRSLAQADILDDVLLGTKLMLGKVIILDVNEGVVMDRLLARFSCGSCNALYNSKSNPPRVDGVCDVCGASGGFVRRDDDRDSVILNRIRLFNEIKSTLLERYKDCSLVVDGSVSPQDVFMEISKALS